MEHTQKHSAELGDMLSAAFALCRKNLMWLLVATVLGLGLGLLTSVLTTNTVNSLDGVINQLDRSITQLDSASLRGEYRDAFRDIARNGEGSINQLGSIAAGGIGAALAISLISLVVSLVGLVIYNKSYSDGSANWSAALKHSVNRFLPAIGTAFLFFAIVIPTSLVLVGVYLAILWVFFFVVVLNENKGGFASFEASRQLVAGRWWKTLLFLIAPGVIIAIINSLFIQVLGGQLNVAASHVLTAVSIGISTLLSQYQAAYLIVMYYAWKHNPIKGEVK